MISASALDIVTILVIVFLLIIIYLFIRGTIISTRGLRETFKDDDDGK